MKIPDWLMKPPPKLLMMLCIFFVSLVIAFIAGREIYKPTKDERLELLVVR